MVFVQYAVFLVFMVAFVAHGAFSQNPALSFTNGKYSVSFSVGASTDAEVAIINASGKIVRHLAAGLLGGTNPPPAPFTTGLSQTVAWDGLDDYGNAAIGTPFHVRVRLGVRPVFERSISTKVFPSGVTYGRGGVSSLGDIISTTHPIWTSGWQGDMYTVTTGLDMTVSDETDEIFLQAGAGLAVPKIAVVNGVTGQFKNAVNLTFPADAWSYYGEPQLNWDGKYLYHDDGNLVRLFRYTLTGAVANFPNGSNVILLPDRGGDYRQRGITGGPDGSIYYAHYSKSVIDEGGPMAVYQFDKNGVMLKDEFIRIHGNIGQGIRVDLHGNVFLGARVKPLGDTIPANLKGKLTGDFATAKSQAWWADEIYGSIVKFGPSGGSILQDNTGNLQGAAYMKPVKATGMQWIHYGASFQSTHSSYRSRCWCYTPRFDVDRFGRVIFPNPFENQYKALDNNGNLIFTLNNKDFSAQAVIGMGHAVEVTDRAMYVADFFNNQIVAFTWSAANEATLNLPATAAEGSHPWILGSFQISNAPNPFHAETILRYEVPSGGAGFSIHLGIYNAAGALIAQFSNLASQSGSHAFAWHLPAGAESGIYFARLTAGPWNAERKMIYLR